MDRVDTAHTGRGVHPIRWLRAHPDAADMLLAILLTGFALTAHLLQIEEDSSDTPAGVSTDPSWWTVILVIAAVFPIAWRRSRPIPSAIVVVASQITAEWFDVGGTGFIGVLVAVYSLGAHADGPARARAAGAIVAGLAVLFAVGLVIDELAVSGLITSTIALVTAFVVGDNLRRRREAARAAEERAARAERERELVAQQQLNAERSRIARELHDVVAHSVSVMVIQAAAARRSLESSPDNARLALSNIEETGRQTMNELRGILGVLRRSDPIDAAAHAEHDGGADPGSLAAATGAGGAPTRDDGPTLAPQPTLDQVDDLIRLAHDLPIAVEVTGDLHDLPQSVTLTGYRVVQEALTNIRRHAGPVTSVEVAIIRDAEHVHVEIADDGRGAAADQSEPGYGLLGMHERVEAVGGRLSAGSRRGGGWRIAASLPLEPSRHEPAGDTATRPDSNAGVAP